jgi:hypothetical protein
MTVKEFVTKFLARWRGEVGGEPTPLDFAHNIPPNASDSDAMAAMVEFMERQGK